MTIPDLDRNHLSRDAYFVHLLTGISVYRDGNLMLRVSVNGFFCFKKSNAEFLCKLI